MSSALRLAVTAALSLAFLGNPASAAEGAGQVTLTGKIACAMCVLHLKGASDCTNVLVVSEKGRDTIYELTDNEVTKAWDMRACEHAVPVKVTGTVSEQGGKKTMQPSRIAKA